jgi:hypothetical protein
MPFTECCLLCCSTARLLYFTNFLAAAVHPAAAHDRHAAAGPSSCVFLLQKIPYSGFHDSLIVVNPQDGLSFKIKYIEAEV